MPGPRADLGADLGAMRPRAPRLLLLTLATLAAAGAASGTSRRVAVRPLWASSGASDFLAGRRLRNTESNGIPKAVEEFNNESMFPKFTDPIQNVTANVGKDALLGCVVDNLGQYKVAWVRVDTQTILSIHHTVITQNPRISLTHNDARSWYLHIKDVHETDRGWYMCQVNTDPMRSRQGYLQVVMPPTIVDKDTSTDMVVRESSNVSLTCKAYGYPEPFVMWRREDGEDISYNGLPVNVVDGETLHITKVSRLHMGAYLCIASNQIPPSISKRVFLRVQFPPMLSIPNQLEGAYIGQDVKLTCHTEAYPHSINYWTTERGDMIVSGNKFEAVSTDNGYNKVMALKIRNVGPDDFGSYKCVAKNSLGETDGVIRLDEIPAPLTSPSTTMLPKKKHRGRVKPLKMERGQNSVLAADSYIDDTTVDESADDDYTLAPHVEVQPPVAQGSGAPPRGVHVGVLSAAAVVVVLAGR